jgi:uncharacterized 2Fe-2S/4Fe-4S cluster protein (DUF4445 family)
VITAVAAVSAGPAFAGDAIMWGEESATGAVRIVMAAPRHEPLLVHRVRPATARKAERAQPMRRGYEERPRGPARILVREL